jgi:hypothetical protein
MSRVEQRDEQARDDQQSADKTLQTDARVVPDVESGHGQIRVGIAADQRVLEIGFQLRNRSLGQHLLRIVRPQRFLICQHGRRDKHAPEQAESQLNAAVPEDALRHIVQQHLAPEPRNRICANGTADCGHVPPDGADTGRCSVATDKHRPRPDRHRRRGTDRRIPQVRLRKPTAPAALQTVNHLFQLCQWQRRDSNNSTTFTFSPLEWIWLPALASRTALRPHGPR